MEAPDESSNILAVLYCRRSLFSFIFRGGLARRFSLVRCIIAGFQPASHDGGSDDFVSSVIGVL